MGGMEGTAAAGKEGIAWDTEKCALTGNVSTAEGTYWRITVGPGTTAGQPPSAAGSGT